MRLYCERQDALVVAKLDPKHHWLFTACTAGVERLLGRRLHRGECVVLDLEAKEVPMGYLLQSKKSRSMGLPWIWGGIVGVLIARHYGVETALIGQFYLGGSIVVAAHMIAYGLADAAHGGKKG